MAQESTQENLWPEPKFYFRVRLGSQNSTASFQEVSGLDTESQPIEYRQSNDPLFSKIKMSGIMKKGNVIL